MSNPTTDPTRELKALPCPFCGGPARISSNGMLASCDGPCVGGCSWHALKDWNTRPATPNDIARNAEVGACKDCAGEPCDTHERIAELEQQLASVTGERDEARDRAHDLGVSLTSIQKASERMLPLLHFATEKLGWLGQIGDGPDFATFIIQKLTSAESESEGLRAKIEA